MPRRYKGKKRYNGYSNSNNYNNSMNQYQNNYQEDKKEEQNISNSMENDISMKNNENNNNNSLEPDFYSQSNIEEELPNKNSNSNTKNYYQSSSNKKEINNINNTMSDNNFGNYKAKKFKNDISMAKNNVEKEEPIKKKNESMYNSIRDEIENEDEKEEISENSEDDGEPDFYAGVKEEENNYNSDDQDNKNNSESFNNSFNPSEDEKKNPKEEEIKFNKNNDNKNYDEEDEDEDGNNINIEYIYEINKKFNYDIDSPVFYLQEENEGYNKYHWPLTTKQIVEKVKENDLNSKSLRVRLVDLFEHKFKEPYIYFDFEDVIKKGWAENIEVSKIFKNLYNSINEASKKKDEGNDRGQSFINSMNDKEMNSLFNVGSEIGNNNAKTYNYGNKSGIIPGEELVNRLNPNNKNNNDGNSGNNKGKNKNKKGGEIKLGFSYE